MGCLAVEGTYDRMEEMMRSGALGTMTAVRAAPYSNPAHQMPITAQPRAALRRNTNPSLRHARPQTDTHQTHPPPRPNPARAARPPGLEPVDVILLLAAAENDDPKIEELLAAGADVRVKDNLGRTPRALATKDKVVAMLDAAEAKLAKA